MNNQIFSAFLSKLKNDKKTQFIVITCLIVIMIICLVFNPTKNTSNTDGEDNISLYVKSLETKLSSTLSEVEKAGDVTVMITLESGVENVLATKITKTETQNGTEIVETPIIVNGKTVIITEKLPKIKGVLIVAEGASDIAVLRRIQQATVSLLDIELNQIEILTKK